MVLATPSEGENMSLGDNNFFANGLEEETSIVAATLNNPANHENLPKAVSMIMEAQHTYVCGGHRSYPIADIFTFALQSMCVRAHCFYCDQKFFALNVRKATPEELVMFIMMPPYSQVAVEAMRQLKKKKVPILLLTDTGLSPGLPYADLTLYCAYRDNHYLYSNIGVHALINVLTRAVNRQVDINAYRKNKEQK